MSSKPSSSAMFAVVPEANEPEPAGQSIRSDCGGLGEPCAFAYWTAWTSMSSMLKGPPWLVPDSTFCAVTTPMSRFDASGCAANVALDTEYSTPELFVARSACAPNWFEREKQ